MEKRKDIENRVFYIQLEDVLSQMTDEQVDELMIYARKLVSRHSQSNHDVVPPREIQQ
jgi:hypothetical protein